MSDGQGGYVAGGDTPYEGNMLMVRWGPGDERRARFVRWNRNGRAIVNMQQTVANAQPRRYKPGFGANRTVDAVDLVGPASALPRILEPGDTVSNSGPVKPRVAEFTSEDARPEVEAKTKAKAKADTKALKKDLAARRAKAAPSKVRPIVEAREAAAALQALGVTPAMPTAMGSVVLRASAALVLAAKLGELGKTERELVSTQECEEGMVEELDKAEDRIRELEDANETLADELKTCKETLANYHREAGKKAKA